MVDEKLKEFKRLFYTRLTRAEIKKELDLNNTEYDYYLKRTKEEFNLPSSYRRRPSFFDRYTKDSYYILKCDYQEDNVSYSIVAYRPSFDCAKEKLSLLDEEVFCEYRIEKASDENLSKIIEHEFYNNNENWECIMQKLKLPYQKFYALLNDLKRKHNTKVNSNRSNRFIYYYKPLDKYVIKKNIDGEIKSFGYYDTEEIAMKVRDYLESVDWNIMLFKEVKEEIIAE